MNKALVMTIAAVGLLGLSACDVQRRQMPAIFNEVNDQQLAKNPGYDPARDYLDTNHEDVGHVVGRAEIKGAPADLGCSPLEMSATATGCSELSCIEAKKKAEKALYGAASPKMCQTYVTIMDQACEKVSCPE